MICRRLVMWRIVVFLGLVAFQLNPVAVSALTLVNSWPTGGPPLGIAVELGGTLILNTSTAIPHYMRYTPQGVLVSRMGTAQYPYPVYGIASASNGDFFAAKTAVAGGFLLDHYAWNGAFAGGAGGPWGGAESAKYVALHESATCSDQLCVDIFVSDPLGSHVVRFRSTGPFGDSYVGIWPAHRPTGITAHNGEVLVATGNGDVLRFTLNGSALDSFSSGAAQAEGLAAGADGRLYLADRGTGPGTSRLLVFTSSGTLLQSIGGTVPGYPFGMPEFIGVAIDGNGTVYATDYANGRVLVFSQEPTAARTATWGHVKNVYR